MAAMRAVHWVVLLACWMAAPSEYYSAVQKAESWADHWGLQMAARLALSSAEKLALHSADLLVDWKEKSSAARWVAKRAGLMAAYSVVS